MNNEFIPYEQAVELKELGFDEPCFAYRGGCGGIMIKETPHCVISAPSFSQAFRWVREKHDLFISIVHYENGYSINDLRRFETYEEAELACLKKLIEIVKK